MNLQASSLQKRMCGGFKSNQEMFEVYNVFSELVFADKLENGYAKCDLSELPRNIYVLKIDNKTWRLVKN